MNVETKQRNFENIYPTILDYLAFEWDLMDYGKFLRVRSSYKMPDPESAYSEKEADLYFDRNTFSYSFNGHMF